MVGDSCEIFYRRFFHDEIAFPTNDPRTRSSTSTNPNFTSHKSAPIIQDPLFRFLCRRARHVTERVVTRFLSTAQIALLQSRPFCHQALSPWHAWGKQPRHSLCSTFHRAHTNRPRQFPKRNRADSTSPNAPYILSTLLVSGPATSPAQWMKPWRPYHQNRPL